MRKTDMHETDTFSKSSRTFDMRKNDTFAEISRFFFRNFSIFYQNIGNNDI